MLLKESKAAPVGPLEAVDPLYPEAVVVSPAPQQKGRLPDRVEVLEGSGRVTICRTGKAVLLAVHQPHFNPWSRLRASTLSRRRRRSIWETGSRFLAAELVGCTLPDGRNAVARAHPGRGGKPLPLRPLPTVTVQWLVAETLARVGIPKPYTNKQPSRSEHRAALDRAGDGVAILNLVWEDWPACGQKGHGVSALWVRRAGKWHLVTTWEEDSPRRLLLAADLDGDGHLEILMETDAQAGTRVLFRLVSRGGKLHLRELRRLEIPLDDCRC